MKVLNLSVFKQAKQMQSKRKNSVVRVVYKNYRGLTLEIEPVELTVIKSSLGLMAQSNNGFLANVRGKYDY